YKTRRRIYLLKKLLAEIGIEPERVRLEWVSATEGAKFARVMREFVTELKKLGPLSVERDPLSVNRGPSSEHRESVVAERQRGIRVDA
ncbi:hydrogenase iron-sulfur subunit, partial [Candidatus Bipolaricaulota bacterium]|nr:hydrogenase iron-sulfur subunit [Candidatus Bipolaricaulota bacterium]